MNWPIIKPALCMRFSRVERLRESQPLIVSITTAGDFREGNVAYEQRNAALQILENVVQRDTYFCYPAEMDEKATTLTTRKTGSRQIQA